MEDCIFCKIAKGEIPAHKVYEDKDVIAFLDISPMVKGHTIVIPKNHSRWLWDIEAKEYQILTERTHYLANVLRKAFNTDWVEELVAGRGIPHTHIHLMPRTKEDGQPEVPTKPLNPLPSEEENKAFIEMIKKELR
jgi:histidine triad (HIT) family protein